MQEGLTYEDVLISPAFSDIGSRNEIDITTNFLGFSRIKPIISAPMDLVSGPEMVGTLANNDYYGILHRFDTPDNLVKQAYSAYLSAGKAPFGVSVGAKNPEETFKWLNRIKSIKIHSICIDVAHGDHQLVIDMIREVKEWAWTNALNVKIIAGNIATASAYARLAGCGIDAIRVGIGSGSACTTRTTTGIGVPQLTALMNCVKERDTNGGPQIIADGGIETSGDIVKALAAGADVVMLGKMLAGHIESPGEIVMIEGKKMKPYRGQSILGSNGQRNAPEGVAGYVPFRGSVVDTLNQLEGWIESGLSYVGARNLTELRQYATFIKVSPATQRESSTRILEI